MPDLLYLYVKCSPLLLITSSIFECLGGFPISNFPSIIVDSFEGLMVNHAVKHSAHAAIRGLRALSDFEFEFKMALMNRSLNDAVSTVFLMPHEKYTHISSSLIKEVVYWIQSVFSPASSTICRLLRL